MKKPTFKAILVLLVAIVAAFGLIGCDEFFESIVEVFTTDITGVVVNAKSDGEETDYWKSDSDTLEDAVISLYKYNESTGLFSDAAYSRTADVDGYGEYELSEVSNGKYKVSGSKDGWTFVPRIVEVSGENCVLPDILAYPNAASNTVTILVSWEDPTLNDETLDHIDLDAHLSYYDGDERSFVHYDSTLTENIHEDVYEVEVDSVDTEIIKLDRDVKSSTDSAIPRVETMTILEPTDITNVPFFNSTNTTDGVSDDELRFYVDRYDVTPDSDETDTTSLTGLDGTNDDRLSAFAEVFVMYQGGSGDAEHLGSWPLPWNTSEDTLHVVTLIAKTNDNETPADTNDDSYYYSVQSAGNANEMKSVSIME